MGLLRIHESKNLQYTLNADHEDGSTNFKVDHTLVYYSSRKCKKAPTDERPMQINSCKNLGGSSQMWLFEPEQAEQPDAIHPRTHGEEVRQEPLEESRKDIDKMDTSKEQPDVIYRGTHDEEARQEPLKGARKDMDTSKEVVRKMTELIEKYEQIQREVIEQSRQERELLMEARKGIATTSKEVTKKVAELFEKYGRVPGKDPETVERQRREHNEEKRELLEEARKAIDNEGTRKVAELFRKYERTLQKGFEAIEQLRKESDEWWTGITKGGSRGEAPHPPTGVPTSASEVAQRAAAAKASQNSQPSNKRLGYCLGGPADPNDRSKQVTVMTRDIKFVESHGRAFANVQAAIFGRERKAEDRIHWMLSPDSDERVSALMESITATEYSLGSYGVSLHDAFLFLRHCY